MRVIENLVIPEDVLTFLTKKNPEPVLIRSNDRDVAMMVSPAEYQRYLSYQLRRAIKRLGKQAKANGLTEEILNEILAEAKAERSAVYSQQ